MEKEETGDLQEGKARFALFVRQSTLDEVNKWYKLDNCSRKSEFIEKAILFYVGYISAESGQEYFPKILTSTLKSIVDESDNRISRIIFKLAVELAVTMNSLLAFTGYKYNVQVMENSYYIHYCIASTKGA